MKIQELFENKNSELLKVALDVLNEQAEKHSEKAQGKRSYGIGGNFSAVISGDVKVRKEFASYHYNMPTRWDAILEIGNNIKDTDSLKLAREVYDTVLNELSDFNENVAINDSFDKYHSTVSLGDDKLVVCCEYARAFCWVGVRVI